MRWRPGIAAGITIPILFFLLLRLLGGSVAIAFLGGALLVLDNALLLETHVMLFDGILVAAILGTLVSYLQSQIETSPQRARVLRLAAGGLAGLAVGTKFTGLVAPGLIAIALGRRLFARGPRGESVWRDAAEMASSGAAVYLAGWVLHFALLTNPGPADAFHPTTGRFFDDLRVTHTTMIEANAGMRTPHPDSSAPISWPSMKVAPFFWAGRDASIHLTGNPVVWWGSTLLFLTMLVNMVRMRVTRLRLHAAPGARVQLWLPVTGFLIAYLPFFGVERVLFLYHYLTPLLFAVAGVLLWLDSAGWVRSDELGKQRLSFYVVLALAVAGFIAMSPVTYGFSFGDYDEWLVALLRSWR